MSTIWKIFRSRIVVDAVCDLIAAFVMAARGRKRR
jgi:hypothetical protein